MVFDRHRFRHNYGCVISGDLCICRPCYMGNPRSHLYLVWCDGRVVTALGFTPKHTKITGWQGTRDQI